MGTRQHRETVIASEAKQSIAPQEERLDRFVASAQNCFAILSRTPRDDGQQRVAKHRRRTREGGYPVRCAFSGRSLIASEYWIVRSSRTMTAEACGVVRRHRRQAFHRRRRGAELGDDGVAVVVDADLYEMRRFALVRILGLSNGFFRAPRPAELARSVGRGQEQKEERPVSFVLGSGSAAFRTLHDDIPFGCANAPPPFPAAFPRYHFKNSKLILVLRSRLTRCLQWSPQNDEDHLPSWSVGMHNWSVRRRSLFVM